MGVVVATVTETSARQVGGGVLNKGPCMGGHWLSSLQHDTPVGPCVLGLLVFSKHKWTRPSVGSLAC